MTTTVEYVKNPEVSAYRNEDGSPFEVHGPLGIGRVYKLYRETVLSRFEPYIWDERAKAWTDKPRCQSYGAHFQCKNVGKYLEPYGGKVKFDGTLEAEAQPDAPRFYLCGIHATSQEQARARAQYSRHQAANAEAAAAREVQRLTREERETYTDTLIAQGDAIEAARNKIIETVRDSGRFAHLVEALDAAIDARDATRAARREAQR